MTRGLRRQVRRIRNDIDAGRPLQERTRIVLGGLVASTEPAACASLLALMEGVERARKDPVAPSPAATPVMDLPAPRLDSPTPQTDAVDRPGPEPQEQKPLRRTSLPANKQWKLVINQPPRGPRPPPPPPYRDNPDDDDALARFERERR